MENSKVKMGAVGAGEVAADGEGKMFRKLRVFNLVMGFAHLAQAILIAVLSNDFAITVTTSYLKFNEMIGRPVTELEEFFTVRVAWLIFAFFIISAAAHFIVALPGFRWYVRNLKKGINYARWYEYMFSASIMIVIIAMLSGVFDFSILLLMFAANAAMIMFGMVMELHNQCVRRRAEKAGEEFRPKWTSFIYGSIIGFVPWIVIGIYFFTAIASSADAVPGFVYAIIIVLFILFNTFAINMLLQYKRVGKWRDYLYGEWMYIVLSLAAKSALGWLVFGGTMRDSAEAAVRVVMGWIG